MTLDTLRNILRDHIWGVTNHKNDKYTWVQVSNLFLFERSYDENAQLESLFSQRDFKQYEELIHKEGKKERMSDILFSPLNNFSSIDRRIISNFLYYQDMVYHTPLRKGGIMKLENDIRGVLWMKKE